MKLNRRRLASAVLAAMPSAAAGQNAPSAQSTDYLRLQAMINGYRNSQLLYVAAKLRIADMLLSGPLPVEDIARRAKAHEDSLYRVLRALAGAGVFSEESGRRFALNPMARLLLSQPGSLRVTAEITGEPWYWRPFGDMLHTVRTGETAFDHIYGKHTWDWFGENPGPAALFDAYMGEVTGNDTRAVIGNYDWSALRTVVDIGGGNGTLLTAVLREAGSARGILFDMPHVIEAARKVLAPEIAARIQTVAGDFFRSVPSGGDIYLLKNILHDWDDAKSREILVVIRRAIPKRGKLLLIEGIVCGPNQPCSGKSSDITMMVRNGGRNRTEIEYRDLLRAGGFELTKTITTPGPGIIEAQPA